MRAASAWPSVLTKSDVQQNAGVLKYCQVKIATVPSKIRVILNTIVRKSSHIAPQSLLRGGLIIFIKTALGTFYLELFVRLFWKSAPNPAHLPEGINHRARCELPYSFLKDTI